MDNHITWPATKEDILGACEGEDVAPEVLDDIRNNLEDGGREYTENEIHDALVTS